jgi:O-acetyl-ADP-ribose deacetylase (regulator of RNase III)
VTCLVGRFSVEIIEGDISAQAVDGVVNAANAALWMGSGVAGALKRRGGDQIEREAMALGPIRPGDAVVTGGGRLPARHVIHAAVMGEDPRTDAGLIAAATTSALAAADARGLESIAIPALGTGVGGFPLEACARLMFDVVSEAAERPGSLRRIIFCLFGKPAFEAFNRVAADAFPPGPDPRAGRSR